MFSLDVSTAGSSILFADTIPHPTMDLTLLFAALCMLGLVAAQEPGSARILAAKHITNEYVVQKKDLVVEYNLYNIGDSTAFDVNLSEDNFNPADFDSINGSTKAHWDRLAPGQNVTHVLTVQPKAFHQIFNFTAAQLQYRSGESQDAIVGYTSAPGEAQIWETSQFDRQFAPHYADWITFLIMTIPTVGIPYLLWYRSKSRYDVKTVANKKL